MVIRVDIHSASALLYLCLVMEVVTATSSWHSTNKMAVQYDVETAPVDRTLKWS